MFQAQEGGGSGRVQPVPPKQPSGPVERRPGTPLAPTFYYITATLQSQSTAPCTLTGPRSSGMGCTTRLALLALALLLAAGSACR